MAKRQVTVGRSKQGSIEHYQYDRILNETTEYKDNIVEYKVI